MRSRPTRDLVLKAVGRVSQTTAEVVLWPIHDLAPPPTIKSKVGDTQGPPRANTCCHLRDGKQTS